MPIRAESHRGDESGDRKMAREDSLGGLNVGERYWQAGDYSVSSNT